MSEVISPNYPYDQENYFPSTQDYYCRVSTFGFKPSDPKYRYVIEEGKCELLPGTNKRIYQQEYEDYKSTL